MTANDPTVLHGPLIRRGGAELLSWELSLDEKKEMVGRIFPHLGDDDLLCLVEWFLSESVAFYADLKRLWADKHARKELALVGFRDAVELALQGKWHVAEEPPSLIDLRSLGEKAQQARRGVVWKEESDGEDEHVFSNVRPN